MIATSDPDDISAQETVRATIGRDFISVVATDLQIDEYLDRLFGNGQAAVTADDALVTVEESSPPTSRQSPKDRSSSPADRASDEPAGTGLEGLTTSEPVADEPGPTPANGKTRRAQDQSKAKARKPRANTGPKASNSIEGQEPAPKPASPVDESQAGGLSAQDPDTADVEESTLHQYTSTSLDDPGSSALPSVEELESSTAAEGNGTLQAATNLLPEFAAAEEPRMSCRRLRPRLRWSTNWPSWPDRCRRNQPKSVLTRPRWPPIWWPKRWRRSKSSRVKRNATKTVASTPRRGLRSSRLWQRAWLTAEGSLSRIWRRSWRSTTAREPASPES